MTLPIIIYLISLAIAIFMFICIITQKHENEDFYVLAIGTIPIINTLFIMAFFTLGIYWTYEDKKKKKIQQNKIYKFLHTKNKNTKSKPYVYTIESN